MKVSLRVDWGVAIGVTYALFVGATVTFVTFAFTQPVELVSADYYQRSISHDARLEAARHADELGDTVRVSTVADGRALMVTLPRDHRSVVSGTLTLYRPSNAHADRVVPLTVDANGIQRVSLDGVAPGRWIVEMEWQAHGRRYYRQQAVQLP
jgi:nitrogen fixation protein FixH